MQQLLDIPRFQASAVSAPAAAVWRAVLARLHIFVCLISSLLLLQIQADLRLMRLFFFHHRNRQ